jgi:hypothetical protein
MWNTLRTASCLWFQRWLLGLLKCNLCANKRGNFQASETVVTFQLVPILTFVFPCIVSIIVIDEQRGKTVLVYLFVPNQLYMFRAMSSPIIRNTWLYLQFLILFTYTAAGWCHGWDGTSVPFHPWRRPTAISVDNIRSSKYSQMLLMMGENFPRKM